MMDLTTTCQSGVFEAARKGEPVSCLDYTNDVVSIEPSALLFKGESKTSKILLTGLQINILYCILILPRSSTYALVGDDI